MTWQASQTHCRTDVTSTITGRRTYEERKRSGWWKNPLRDGQPRKPSHWVSQVTISDWYSSEPIGGINNSPLVCSSSSNEVNTDDYISNNNRLFYEVVELENERERQKNDRWMASRSSTKLEILNGSQMQRRRWKSSVTAFSLQNF
jgi:hypothetical protein